MHTTPTRRAQVGIVGAGQLARMTVQAAISLGVSVRLLAARADDSAALVWPDVLIGSPTSAEALSRLASSCCVVTFDHELVDITILRELEAGGACLRPSAATLAVAQDKWQQRRALAAAGLPVPPHRLARVVDDVVTFASEHGWPVVAKARRGGYDGRGVRILEDRSAAEQTIAEWTGRGIELLLERFVPIEQELAVLVARRPGGEMVTYPVVQSIQVEGICREVLAPAEIEPEMARFAQAMARSAAEALRVVGILALELFLAEGQLYVNEIATRPHNSGHYTIEGCTTSQFENHLRAILDWPLGGTALTGPYVAMANLIASDEAVDLAASLPAALAIEGVRVHLYGKAPRPGRKIGHVTSVGGTLTEARRRAQTAAAVLLGQLPPGGGP